ncbi:MAG: DUF2252 family protein [Caulobacteraceae bacterium]
MTQNENSPRSEERTALLLAHRRLKMARSAHAFVRGATGQFYSWLNGHLEHCRGYALEPKAA